MWCMLMFPCISYWIVPCIKFLLWVLKLFLLLNWALWLCEGAGFISKLGPCKWFWQVIHPWFISCYISHQQAQIDVTRAPVRVFYNRRRNFFQSRLGLFLSTIHSLSSYSYYISHVTIVMKLTLIIKLTKQTLVTKLIFCKVHSLHWSILLIIKSSVKKWTCLHSGSSFTLIIAI